MIFPDMKQYIAQQLIDKETVRKSSQCDQYMFRSGAWKATTSELILGREVLVFSFELYGDLWTYHSHQLLVFEQVIVTCKHHAGDSGRSNKP